MLQQGVNGSKARLVLLYSTGLLFIVSVLMCIAQGGLQGDPAGELAFSHSKRGHAGLLAGTNKYEKSPPQSWAAENSSSSTSHPACFPCCRSQLSKIQNPYRCLHCTMQATMLLTNKVAVLGQARAGRTRAPVAAKPALPRRQLAGRVRAEQVWQQFCFKLSKCTCAHLAADNCVVLHELTGVSPCLQALKQEGS